MQSRRFRILCAEDNPEDAIFIRHALRETPSVDLTILPDADAVEACLEGRPPYDHQPRPDLLLLDLKLPRKSGLDVLRWIRSHPDLHSFPVIILTSSLRESDVNRAYELGVMAYVVKPLVLRDLAATLYGVLPIESSF